MTIKNVVITVPLTCNFYNELYKHGIVHFHGRIIIVLSFTNASNK